MTAVSGVDTRSEYGVASKYPHGAWTIQAPARRAAEIELKWVLIVIRIVNPAKEESR